MRTIGLIGGMSWESTLIYYRLINEGVRARLGGHHSPELVLWSVDFAGIESLQRAGAWDKAGAELAAAARRYRAGEVSAGSRDGHVAAAAPPGISHTLTAPLAMSAAITTSARARPVVR